MKCDKCKKEKSTEDFKINNSKPNGYNNICIECQISYRKEYYSTKERTEANTKTYEKLHRDTKHKKAGRNIKSICPTCENLVYMSTKQFESGNRRYCSRRCRAIANVFNLLITSLKARAKKKKVDFNLDAEFLKDLIISQDYKCAVTGVPLILRHSYEGTTIYDSASLDRIDNSKGYTKDNVQWVVLGINYMKMDYSQDEVYELINRIKNTTN